MIGALVLGAFLSSPAQARGAHRHLYRHHHQPAADRATPAPAISAVAGNRYDLAATRRPHVIASLAENRKAPYAGERTLAPSDLDADFWAGLPNPSMTYRAGKRGPVVELGAMAADIQPIPGATIARDDSSLAHVSMAWKF
jgi:hypothetical protein